MNPVCTGNSEIISGSYEPELEFFKAVPVPFNRNPNSKWLDNPILVVPYNCHFVIGTQVLSAIDFLPLIIIYRPMNAIDFKPCLTLAKQDNV